ncbi:hypothetical protein IT157_00395 [bacterium]|nr:hypothetical protein [bacterium]
MEQVRLILALASFAIGALIALRSLFRKPSTLRRSPALALLYSTLFVVAGVWLLQRSAEPQMAQKPDAVSTPKTRPDTARANPSVTDSASVSGKPALSQELKPESKDESKPQIDVHSTSEAPIRLTTSAPWDRKLGVSQSRLNRHRPDLAAVSKRNRKAEDVVEDAVITAFDWIELFFARHASPATPSSTPSPEQSFTSPRARIQFVSGSAELEPASAGMVRAMAPTLASRFPSGALVVRATADEDATNPALRTLLAQARAQTVCELLSSGGFPADRLIASAAEAPADANSVEFVHRP